MAAIKINIGANLSDIERRLVQNKFDTASDFFSMPVKFVDNQLWIGFGPEVETEGIWAELSRKLGDRAWSD